MDTKRHLLIISGNFLISLFVLLSCRTSEKIAVSCPEFSINKYKVTTDHKRVKDETLTSHFKGTTRKQPVRLSGKKPGKDFLVIKTPAHSDILYPGIESVSFLNKAEYLKGLVTSTNYAIAPLAKNTMTLQLMKKIEVNKQSNNFYFNHSSRCDTIMLKSGSILIVKVEETGQAEIKYRECNNSNSPVISISKSNVSEIRYTNGTHEILTSVNPSDFVFKNATISDNKTTIKKARFGIFWFVTGLAGLFVLSGLLVFGLPGLFFAAIALGLIGLILKIIGRIRRKRDPAKLKGKRSETGHLIIDIIVVAGVVLGLMLSVFFLMFILGSLI